MTLPISHPFLMVALLSIGACQSGTTKDDSSPDGTHDAEHGSDEDDSDSEPPDTRDPSLSCIEDEGVIVPTPAAHSDYKDWGFDRYTELLAPNGKPIRIFAEDGVTETSFDGS